MTQDVPPAVVDDSRLTATRTREPPKNEAGQIYCDYPYCHDHIFKRRSEWNKHMDKHDRPYKCTSPGCNQRFTLVANMRRHLRIHQVSSKGKWMCPYSDCDRSSGAGFTRNVYLKIHIQGFHMKRDSSEYLRAVTQLQREVIQRDSRLDKTEMELTGKETYFALSPSVRLPSCAELEAGVPANGFHKTELHMFKEDSGKLLRMAVRSLLNPPDEGEKKVDKRPGTTPCGH
ncbi:hypothetical protein PABG_12331 [Paracoccidioides brasiliensis Pb03]|nr:hypothetical protein PABG_12331 [Paracoccidioides brasiliensis Pb03]